jgi:DNA modification methylase
MTDPSMIDPPFAAPYWAANHAEKRNPALLKPHPKNPRIHDPVQIKNLRSLIDEFGAVWPLALVDEKDVIWAGHGRVMAAMLDPPIEQIPVVVARGWSKEKKLAFMVADNRIAETSTWDRDLLRGHLEALNGQFDLAIAGFDAMMLPQFLAAPNSGFADPDEEAPAPKPDPVVRLGDLWQLGKHYILCGDSTSPAAVSRLLDGARPNLMVTDPPYGVEYDPAWRTKAGVGSKGAATGVVLNDDRADWSEAWRLFPGNVAYVWHGALQSALVAQSLLSCGFDIRAQIIWVKTRAALSRGAYHWKHEPAWYAQKPGTDDGWRFGVDHEVSEFAVREGATAKWVGGRRQTTVWEIDHVKNDTGHGTQKPVECMKRPIENNSVPGDAIYEPFSGSGTTLIAAEMAGRVCFALELSPAYVQVAIERWEKFTRQRALLDGKTLDEVAADRRSAKPRGK